MWSPTSSRWSTPRAETPRSRPACVRFEACSPAPVWTRATTGANSRRRTGEGSSTPPWCLTTYYLHELLAIFDVASVDREEFRAGVASFVKQVNETGRPLVLTQRGRGVVVVLDIREFEAMRERLALLEDIARAEAQLAAGEGIRLWSCRRDRGLHRPGRSRCRRPLGRGTRRGGGAPGRLPRERAHRS
jgi:antitoxin YefM